MGNVMAYQTELRLWEMGNYNYTHRETWKCRICMKTAGKYDWREINAV